MIYIKEIYFKKYLTTDAYLNNIPAIKNALESDGINFTSAVTFLVGENGTGKTTILDGIAAQLGLNLEGGSKNFLFSTREKNPALSDLIIISKSNYPQDSFYFKAESFYNAATYIEETGVGDNYGDRPLHEQSHGERFLSLVRNRFRGHGIYLLDEPETALSPQSQLTLLAEIRYLVKQDSQFIISTHSPIIMSYPNSTIFELSASGINKVTYEETATYNLYSSFLKGPQQYFKHLF